jgi:RNA polymerase sigma factor (sigma-70 family)
MACVTPEFLASLIARYGDPLKLYARQFAGRYDDGSADDVVQEAFMQLVRQRRLPDDAAAWLFRVVRNGALSTARSAARRRRRESVAGSERPEWFEPTFEARLDGASAAAALVELPDDERETVVAHLWGGLTFEQIATVMGVSSSTAHRRYEQGLDDLRKRLEQPCRPTTL